MKRFLVIIALMSAVLVVDAVAQVPTPPILTAEQRLAMELANLHLRNTALAIELDKAKAENEALKAAVKPVEPKGVNP